ncbi:putative reverse transcriptase domain-containing protein [Tanacetum coccineum]
MTAFAKKLNMTPTPLIERVIISTPMKNHMLIDHEYVNCPLCFDDRIRPANLLPIHMLDFDVILGMDWLASHRATIDCYARTVIFGNVRQPEFVYHGSSPLKSVKLIAMKARELTVQLQEMLENGFIRPSVFTVGCTGLICKKKDVEMRLCMITAELNLRVREQDISKTAFRTRYSHYKVLWLCLSSANALPVYGFDESYFPRTASLWDPSKVEGYHQNGRSDLLTVTDLMRKGEKFVWTDERQESFEELKREIGVCSDIESSIRFRWFSDIQVMHRRKVWGWVVMQTWKSKIWEVACLDPLILLGLVSLDVVLCVRGSGGYWASMRIESNLMLQIKEAQRDDGELWAIVQNVEDGKHTEFSVDDDGVVWFEDRLCVPNDQALREKVMTEAHSSPFTIHPGSTKMYRDLKQYFWWNGMKQDVATFPLEIPMWKWDEISMDFVTGLPLYSEKT